MGCTPNAPQCTKLGGHPRPTPAHLAGYMYCIGQSIDTGTPRTGACAVHREEPSLESAVSKDPRYHVLCPSQQFRANCPFANHRWTHGQASHEFYIACMYRRQRPSIFAHRTQQQHLHHTQVLSTRAPTQITQGRVGHAIAPHQTPPLHTLAATSTLNNRQSPKAMYTLVCVYVCVFSLGSNSASPHRQSASPALPSSTPMYT